MMLREKLFDDVDAFNVAMLDLAGSGPGGRLERAAAVAGAARSAVLSALLLARVPGAGVPSEVMHACQYALRDIALVKDVLFGRTRFDGREDLAVRRLAKAVFESAELAETACGERR
jgi:hypothetical protein